MHSADIDRIVREVLAELRSAGAAADGESVRRNGETFGKSEARGATGANAQASGLRECVIADRVVTLATLDGRLDGAAVVTVRRGAVVTPAVRDELKSRSIRLEFADDGNPGAVENTIELVVGVADISGDAAALMKMTEGCVAGVAKVQAIQNTNLPAAVRQVGKALAEGRSLGLILTSRPAAAAGLANRIGGVRAAWACNVQAVSEAIKTFAPNVLAYHPAQHATFEQRAMLREFVRHGVPECPAEFR